MKRKAITIGALAAASLLGAAIVTGNNSQYEACMRSVIVDVMPIPGESWEQHTARMDAAARDFCLGQVWS